MAVLTYSVRTDTTYELQFATCSFVIPHKYMYPRYTYKKTQEYYCVYCTSNIPSLSSYILLTLTAMFMLQMQTTHANTMIYQHCSCQCDYYHSYCTLDPSG